ncbi:MAG: hypothetical protein H7138_16825 [Myxococcales bacterium]|nr:hypothetical protein [Myxococcales bacterium]
MTPVRATLGIAVLLGACGVEISNGGAARVGDAGAGDASTVDASLPIVGGDAGTDAAPVTTCGRRTLFLSFDGQTLQRGTSDATLNQASWMQIAQGTAPRYRANDAGRDAKITAIVDGVRAQLLAFPITVVQTRPTSGEYMMIVLGGQPNQVGSAFGVAVNTLDCDDSEHNDVAWVDDDVAPSQRVVNIVIGAIGLGLGLTAVNDPNDCMCSWGNNCNGIAAAPCQLGPMATRDPNVPAGLRCAGAAAIQNEPATVRAAFCDP